MRVFQYTFAILALFLVWAGISWALELAREQSILPYPWDTLIAGWEHRGELGAAFGASMQRFLIALVLAFALGTPIGLGVGGNQRLHRWLSPFVYLIYPIPPVALLVFLYLAFGVGEAVKVVVVFVSLFFQLLVAALGAARNIPPSHVLTVRAQGANALQLHRHVVLPAVLPSVLTAARVSVGLGITMLYISETMLGMLGGARSGLGNFIEYYRFRPELSLAGVVGLALLGLIFYALLELLERCLCPWKHVEGVSGA